MRTAAVILLVFAAPATALAQTTAAQLEVAEAALATSIEDRQPAGVAESFPADVGQIYLWTRVTGAEGATVVEHVWYRGETEVDRVSLNIGGPNWRTWSAKTIPPDWTGSWRVEVLGPDDTVLETVTFTVG